MTVAPRPPGSSDAPAPDAVTAASGARRAYYSDDYVTIYHGRCEEVLEWLAADVLVTDPPYGMGLKSNRSKANDLSIASDHDATTRDNALALWGERPALVFGRWSIPHPPATRMLLTWDKGEHTGMGDLSLPWKPVTEEVYVLGRGFSAPHRGSSVLHYLAPAPSPSVRMHPTEKPIRLMRHLVGTCPAGLIADPFMGSGSTLRAAKDLGRKAIGIEMDERYCEIAARRMGQDVLDLGGAA